MDQVITLDVLFPSAIGIWAFNFLYSTQSLLSLVQVNQVDIF